MLEDDAIMANLEEESVSMSAIQRSAYTHLTYVVLMMYESILQKGFLVGKAITILWSMFGISIFDRSTSHVPNMLISFSPFINLTS